MDPKKDKWEYAGEADVSDWKTWKEYSNSKDGSDEFHYQDETPESISRDRVWPETGYQENPKKMK